MTRRISADDFMGLAEVEKRRIQQREYQLSERGMQARRAWYERNKDRMRARKNERQKARRNAARSLPSTPVNPDKFRARELVRNAVRRGFIPRPEGILHWYNRWEFHHPDYSRPYFGVWLRGTAHRLVEDGSLACPSCTDWAPIVRAALLAEWGFADSDGVSNG